MLDLTDAASLSACAREMKDFPALRSVFEAPHIRSRIHTICALYYFSPRPDVRKALLSRLEDLTLEVAHLLAVDLLENGWRPASEAPDAAA